MNVPISDRDWLPRIILLALGIVGGVLGLFPFVRALSVTKGAAVRLWMAVILLMAGYSVCAITLPLKIIDVAAASVGGLIGVYAIAGLFGLRRDVTHQYYKHAVIPLVVAYCIFELTLGTKSEWLNGMATGVYICILVFLTRPSKGEKN